MSSSLAPDLRVEFEPRSAVHARPHLALVPAPASGRTEPFDAGPLEVGSPEVGPLEIEPSAPASSEPLRYTPGQAELVALLPGLRRRAVRWCRDAALADDLVQETLLRACRHTGGVENEAHLQAWAHTVLHNLLVSRGRRERSARRALAVLGAAASEGVSGWTPPAPAFLLPSLERALGNLPEAFAGALRLVDLEEHSYAEAAALLGVPVGTVMSRLFRGRRRLARALLKDQDVSA